MHQPEESSEALLNEERLCQLEAMAEDGIGDGNFIELGDEILIMINTRYGIMSSAQYGTMTPAQSARLLTVSCKLLTHYLVTKKDEQPLVQELVKLAGLYSSVIVYKELALAYLKNQRYGSNPFPSRAIYFALNANQTESMDPDIVKLFNHIECAISFDIIEATFKSQLQTTLAEINTLEDGGALHSSWIRLKDWVGWFVNFEDTARLQSVLNLVVNLFFKNYLADCPLSEFEKAIEESCNLVALLRPTSNERITFYNSLYTLIGRHSNRFAGASPHHSHRIDAEAPKKEQRFITVGPYIPLQPVWLQRWEEAKDALAARLDQDNANACALYARDIRELLEEIAFYASQQLGSPSNGNEFAWLLQGSFALGNGNIDSDIDCAFLVAVIDNKIRAHLSAWIILVNHYLALLQNHVNKEKIFPLQIDSDIYDNTQTIKARLINTPEGLAEWIQGVNPSIPLDRSEEKFAYGLYAAQLIYASSSNGLYNHFKKAMIPVLQTENLGARWFAYNGDIYRSPSQQPVGSVAETIKVRYLSPLTRWCMDVALEHGLVVTAVPDKESLVPYLLKQLAAKGIVNSLIAEALIRCWLRLQQLRFHYARDIGAALTALHNEELSQADAWCQFLYWPGAFPQITTPLGHDCLFSYLQEATQDYTHSMKLFAAITFHLLQTPSLTPKLRLQIHRHYYRAIPEAERASTIAFTYARLEGYSELAAATGKNAFCVNEEERAQLWDVPSPSGQRKSQQQHWHAWEQQLQSLFKERQTTIVISSLVLNGRFHLSAEVISELKRTKWLKADGQFIEKDKAPVKLDGNHLVIPYREPVTNERPADKCRLIYFKIFPEYPLKELMFYDLVSRLSSCTQRAVDVWLWQSGGQEYPVLVSEAVLGTPLATLTATVEPFELDPQWFCEQLLVNGLTRQEDLRAENCQLVRTQHGRARIVPFDIDRWGILTFDKWGRLQVKDILFCLPQMNAAIDPIFREEFLSLNCHAVIRAWVQSAEEWGRRCRTLFTDDRIKTFYAPRKTVFFNKEFIERSVLLPPLPFNAPKKLAADWQAISDVLTGKDEVSNWDIIFAASRRLGRHYQQEHARAGGTPHTIFHKLCAHGYKDGSYVTSMIDFNQHSELTGSTSSATDDLIPRWQAQMEQWQCGVRALVNSSKLITSILEALNSGGLPAPGGHWGAPLLSELSEHLSAENIAEPLQRQLLKHLQAFTHYDSLTFKDWTTLTDADVVAICKLSPTIRILRIINCPLITGNFLLTWPHQSCTLERLDLINLPITQLFQWERFSLLRSADNQYRPIPLPSLVSLSVSGCTQLTGLVIHAPELVILNLHQTQALRTVITGSEGLGRLVVTESRLEPLELLRVANRVNKLQFERTGETEDLRAALTLADCLQVLRRQQRNSVIDRLVYAHHAYVRDNREEGWKILRTLERQFKGPKKNEINIIYRRTDGPIVENGIFWFLKQESRILIPASILFCHLRAFYQKKHYVDPFYEFKPPDNTSSLIFNYLRAVYWLRHNHIEKARKFYSNVIKNKKKWPEFQTLLAEIYWWDNGVVLDSLDLTFTDDSAFKSACVGENSQSWAWSRQGHAFNRKKNYEHALTCFEHACELEPKHADYWADKGVCLRLLNRYQEAHEALNKALCLDDNYADAWHYQGCVFESEGDHEQALTCYTRACKLASNNAEYWTDKGEYLLVMNRYEEAHQALNEALRLDGGDAYAWNRRGCLFESEGDHKQASTCYTHACELDPNNAEYWTDKGGCLEKMNRYEEAHQALNEALRLDDGYADAWNYRGIVFVREGDYKQALICYTRACELMPNNSNYLANKSECLRSPQYGEKIRKAQETRHSTLIAQLKTLGHFAQRAELPAVTAEETALSAVPTQDEAVTSAEQPAQNKI